MEKTKVDYFFRFENYLSLEKLNHFLLEDFCFFNVEG